MSAEKQTGTCKLATPGLVAHCATTSIQGRPDSSLCGSSSRLEFTRTHKPGAGASIITRVWHSRARSDTFTQRQHVPRVLWGSLAATHSKKADASARKYIFRKCGSKHAMKLLVFQILYLYSVPVSFRLTPERVPQPNPFPAIKARRARAPSTCLLALRLHADESC